jgi:hypothetical protein
VELYQTKSFQMDEGQTNKEEVHAFSGSEATEELKANKTTQNQTESMEVHHHPDLRHKKKHLREYLLEFLMIFLAVTLGFLAESLREHISEKDRSGVFAQSLAEDFKADTSTLNQLINYTQIKIRTIDSLDYCIHTPRNRYNDSILYRSLIFLISTFQFDNINGTYEQIKNSGSMRFFDQTLVNNLNRYDATSLKLKLMEDWENKFLYEKLSTQIEEKFNYKVFNDMRENIPIKHEMYLRNINEETVDILLNQAETIKRLRARQLSQQKILLQKATEILAGLNKEFDLQN